MSTEPIPSRSGASAAQGAVANAGGERRQITVLFCDIVGSTSLAEQLDPEDMREVFERFYEHCVLTVARFEGHVARLLGDAVLVYFGYPAAREDDAVRAVRAAVAMVQELEALNATLGRFKARLAVRVGVHTGLVVLGGGDSKDGPNLVGDTPNIAARIQGAAAANTVAISETTMGLVQGFFQIEDLGAQSLKGISSAVRLYRVSGERDVANRFDVQAERGLNRMVGRSSELDLLLGRWATASSGELQCVRIVGEAGIGKSRLVHELRETLAAIAHGEIPCSCSPYHQNSALYPLRWRLEREFGFNKEDDPGRNLAKLEAWLKGIEPALGASLPILASLMGISGPAPDPELSALAPDQLKALTSDALMRIIQTLSDKQPLLVVIEDLHWIDPSTFEFLQAMMRRLRHAPILLVLTVRAEAAARSWDASAQMIDIPLARLSAADSAQIVGQISAHAIPQPVIDEMVAKSDGVPLFLEEVTRSILATGARVNAAVAIPASLQDSLVARLDMLSSVRRLAQFAATLGRNFNRSLFEALAPFAPAEIEAGLAQLSAAGLLLVSDNDGDRIYQFKHALLQDAAYQSLLKGARRQYHHLIAEGLERKFPHSAVNDPELLAHHFTEAGDAEKAIDYWMKAGKRAKERSANAEAAIHFERGLQLVATLGEGKQKAALEFALHVGSIAPLTALKGYSSPEVERAFGRALELSPQVSESAETFTALSARLSYLLVSGQIDRARLYNQENVRLAERLNDRGSLITAYRGLGVVHLLSGHAEDARPQFERALALYDPEQHRKLAFVLGQDARVTGLSYLVLVLWHLGRIEDAVRLHTEALEAVRELGHHNSTGLALTYAGAFFHTLCRNGETVERHAAQLIQLGDEHKLPLWSATGRYYLGFANAQQQRDERGIALMSEGLEALKRIQVRLFRPVYLTSLAQAYVKASRLDEARACLAEADELATTGGERWFFPEQLRTHGEVELRAGDLAEAERRFEAAHALAREQRSKSLELRAATSLGTVLLRQGKSQAARGLLAPVCNSFAKSLTLPDLKDARAVLRDTAPGM